MSLREVVVRPLITEKSSAAYQNRKEYAFMVHPSANKHQIREALERQFGVHVTALRTMQVRRREVMRGRIRGSTTAWKKAIVSLREGESLPIFEG
ncbi:MAG: 50S ribosomal protein L23 [Gemmatimonadales bacterium]